MDEETLAFAFGASLPWGAIGIAVAWALNHFLPRWLRPVCRSVIPATAAAAAVWNATGGKPLWLCAVAWLIWALLMQAGRVTGRGLEPYDDIADFKKKFFGNKES